MAQQGKAKGSVMAEIQSEQLSAEAHAAAMADYLATAADARTVQISVVAETIATYFELRELIARADVLEDDL